MAVIETISAVSERQARPPLVFEASHQQLATEYPNSITF
jgi:hypothetical protein